jgi:hypothetical protein
MIREFTSTTDHLGKIRPVEDILGLRQTDPLQVYTPIQAPPGETLHTHDTAESRFKFVLQNVADPTDVEQVFIRPEVGANNAHGFELIPADQFQDQKRPMFAVYPYLESKGTTSSWRMYGDVDNDPPQPYDELNFDVTDEEGYLGGVISAQLGEALNAQPNSPYVIRMDRQTKTVQLHYVHHDGQWIETSGETDPRVQELLPTLAGRSKVIVATNPWIVEIGKEASLSGNLDVLNIEPESAQARNIQERRDPHAVDIAPALEQLHPYRVELDDAIRGKRINTHEWVRSTFGDDTTPIYLTRPTIWSDESEDVQGVIAEWMAEVIRGVYGSGYPLPNINADFNLRGIQARALLPYVALVGPQNLNHGVINERPDLLKNPDIVRQLEVVATAAIVMGSSGFAELGRTGRRPEIAYNSATRGHETAGFDAGTIIMERMLDWATNRHRLLEMIHTMTSDMRAADRHQSGKGMIPSSGPIQNLLLGHLGQHIVYAAPLYDVGHGQEPFLHVEKTRDHVRSKEINRGSVVYTYQGPHQDLLQAIWQHQLGQPVDLRTFQGGDTSQIQDLVVEANYNGPNVYGDVKVHERPHEGPNAALLDNAIQELDQISPVTVVKVPANRPEAAVVQAGLAERGFVPCGVSVAHDDEYLQVNPDGSLDKARYKAPPHIYMARLGQNVGTVHPAYYPTPEDAGGRDLHGSELRQMLYALDHQIRNSRKAA